MNIHKNARTTPHSRLLVVRRVLDQKQPAAERAFRRSGFFSQFGGGLMIWTPGARP